MNAWVVTVVTAALLGVVITLVYVFVVRARPPRPELCALAPRHPPTPSAEACVTFTCTTHRRLAAFLRTFDSVLENLQDQHLIQSWIIIDDDSTLEDRLFMQLRYPFVTFVGKGHGFKKQPTSIQMILSLARTRYALMWEDDWTLLEPLSVQGLVQAMKTHHLHQLTLHAWGLDSSRYVTTSRPGALEVREVALTPSDQEHLKRLGVTKYCGHQDNWTSPTMPPWPLFTLHPSLNDLDFLRSLPPVNTSPAKNSKPFYYQFEMEYATWFVLRGGRKASTAKDYISSKDTLTSY